ncbi:MFS transporter [Paenibacillus donghaensis]|uniref:Major facilitator superfamily (MFS) profile domain-containing protein n=1 Tax=Paenibacillus donghaensis TaxID=414771 RepID=A0A2Z2KQ85_9BACL|nr:MFS transporter [Paenibacillus donghaensis]ASA25953.1 hypothetical protein B9T62_37730 [Paenibacillus donghaensis]
MEDAQTGGSSRDIMSLDGLAPEPRINRTAVKLVICLGAFLSNLSAGMFNIALVDISADLAMPVASVQWVVSIYLLVISVLLPVMGRLGDMLGRRRIHNLGLFAFAAGALGCALAPNALMLLGFRVLQGIGASMYQATNMALIVSLFPQEQRGRALGLMSTFVAAGSMAGPGVGGFLIQWFSWQSNFWLLAVIAAAAGALAQRIIPADRETAGGRLELGRTLVFAAGLSSLMVAVDLGGRTSFRSLPVLLLLLVPAVIAAWIWTFRRKAGRQVREKAAGGPQPDYRERGRDSGSWGLDTAGKRLSIGERGVADRERLAGDGEGNESSAGQLGDRRRSVTDADLFADQRIQAGIVVTVVTYMAAFTAQLALPVFLRLAGAPPAWVGLVMIGYPLALVLTAPLSGGIADRKGPLGILSAGLLLMSATLLCLGFFGQALGQEAMVVPIVLLGCSMGMITSPNTSIVMGLAPQASLGRVSSLLALSRNIGMMFGTAAGGMMLAGGMAGTGGGTMAVFVVCAAGVALSWGWLVHALRRNGNAAEAGRRPLSPANRDV